MKVFDAIQLDHSAITQAAGHFVISLAGDDIQTDVILAAELSGLMLLRRSKAKLGHLRPGAAVFEPDVDAALSELQRFISRLAKLNGLDPEQSDFSSLTLEAMRYCPRVVQFEQPLYASCRKFSVAPELRSHVAACAAIKLVVAGRRGNHFTAQRGLALVIHHVIAGAITAPYPDES